MEATAHRPLEDGGDSMAQARQVGGAGNSLLLVLAHFSPSLLFLLSGYCRFQIFCLPEQEALQVVYSLPVCLKEPPVDG